MRSCCLSCYNAACHALMLLVMRSCCLPCGHTACHAVILLDMRSYCLPCGHTAFILLSDPTAYVPSYCFRTSILLSSYEHTASALAYEHTATIRPHYFRWTTPLSHRHRQYATAVVVISPSHTVMPPSHCDSSSLQATPISILPAYTAAIRTHR